MNTPSTVADTLDAGPTPGPWKVFDHYCGRDPETAGEYAKHRLIGQGQFDTIADVRHGHDDLAGNVDANARLLAAAPDLLAACIAAEDFCAAEPGDPAYSIYRQLHAAIAKARGEVQP